MAFVVSAGHKSNSSWGSHPEESVPFIQSYLLKYILVLKYGSVSF